MDLNENSAKRVAMTERTLILHNVKNRKGQAKSDKSNPRQNTYGQNKRGYKTNF